MSILIIAGGLFNVSVRLVRPSLEPHCRTHFSSIEMKISRLPQTPAVPPAIGRKAWPESTIDPGENTTSDRHKQVTLLGSSVIDIAHAQCAQSAFTKQ